MKHLSIALLAALLVAAFPASRALACDEMACVSAAEWTAAPSIELNLNVGDAASGGIRALAKGLKHGAHFVGDLPEQARKQVAAQSPHLRNSVRTVADRAEHSLQQLSVEVTSLSLQLLRSVFSSFWAFISGLLLS